MRLAPALLVPASLLVALAAILRHSTGEARPLNPPQLSRDSPEVRRDPDVSREIPTGSGVLEDTIWIADWSFDTTSGECTDAGWARYDNRILNDGSDYWSIRNSYAGTGGIVNMSPTDHLGLNLSAFHMLEIKNGDWTLVPGT